MGSWHGTCGVTHLPIRSGDPVRALLIVQNPHVETVAGNYCYTYGLYEPITFFFEGEYNDYGSIEDVVETINTRIIVSRLGLGLDGRESQTFYIQADNSDITTIEGLLDAVERGYVVLRYKSFNKPGETRLQVGLWMIHEWVYQHLLESNAGFRAKLLREEGVEGTLTGQRYLWHMTYGMMGGSAASSYTRYRNEHPEATAELMEALIQWRVIQGGMGSLRIGFSPQTGAGSQADELEPYAQLAMKVVDYIREDNAIEEEFSLLEFGEEEVGGFEE